MRLLLRAAVALLVAGCNSPVTQVEVGAGRVPIVFLSGSMGLPAAAARAGEATGTWFTEEGERVSVMPNGDKTFLSASEDIQFFSADQAMEFRKQLGGRERALVRIDVEVQRLSLRADSIVDPQPFTGEAVLDGTVLGPNGFTGRVTLSQDTLERVITDEEDGKAVELGFGLQVDCSRDELQTVPGMVVMGVALQPILVVQALNTF